MMCTGYLNSIIGEFHYHSVAMSFFVYDDLDQDGEGLFPEIYQPHGIPEPP